MDSTCSYGGSDKQPAKQNDVKNLPHYTAFKMQPIDFFLANIGVLDFLQMCAIKYICRFKMKNGLEDLDKAENYIRYMRQQWEKDHPKPVPTRDPRECSSECTGRCAGCAPHETRRI